MNDKFLEKIRKELPTLPAVVHEDVLTMPPFTEIVSNLAKSITNNIDHAMDGDSVIASMEEVERRLTICNQCEFYEQASKRCFKCGCFLKIKAAWVKEKCPVDKW